MNLQELINHCKEVAHLNYNICGKHFNIDETRFIIIFVDGFGDYRKINCPESAFIKIFNRYKSKPHPNPPPAPQARHRVTNPNLSIFLRRN